MHLEKRGDHMALGFKVSEELPSFLSFCNTRASLFVAHTTLSLSLSLSLRAHITTTDKQTRPPPLKLFRSCLGERESERKMFN